MRKFKVVVNGREYDVEVVEVSEAEAPAPVMAEPSARAVCAGEGGPDTGRPGAHWPSVPAPGPVPATTPRPAPAPAAPVGPSGPASPGTGGAGSVAPSAPAAAKPEALVGEAVKKVEAPLAGTILSVRVKEGDRVKVGDVLVTLEALKLENEIASPYSGIVRSVNVSAGESVQAGALLMTVEESAS